MKITFKNLVQIIFENEKEIEDLRIKNIELELQLENEIILWINRGYNLKETIEFTNLTKIEIKKRTLCNNFKRISKNGRTNN